VIIQNPEKEGDKPFFTEKEDGVLDMGVERRWTMMGAPLHDFHV